MIRILIADDEEYVRDLLVKTIRGEKEVEEVAVAGDGMEALEVARQFHPDLVVTDISMPRLNGLELIKCLQNEGISCKTVIISGYDEFDYAKQAISLGVKDYLLKPFLPEEMIQILQKVSEDVENQRRFRSNMEFLQEKVKNGKNLAKEKRILSLLKGKEDKGNLEIWEEEGKDFWPGSLCAGMMRFYETGWKFESQDQVEEFLTLIREGYFSKKLHLSAIALEDTELAFIWSIREQDPKALKNYIQIGFDRMQESFEKYYGGSFRCSVGGIYDDIKNISLSYEQAVNLWKCSFDGKKSVMFYGDECEKEEEDLSEQIREWKSRICSDVKMAQKKNAKEDLQQLMRCYASFSTRRADYIGASIGELIYAMENDMEVYETEGERRKILKKDFLEHASLMELEQLLEEYVIDCCDIVKRNSEKNRADQMVRQAKELIASHLENPDLSLEWMEEQMHFSASYIRQTFKQKTGESISEYLIRKRMEKAGQLLERENGKVQDVAKACGYENQRYFASSFKKFYGCTPTEYKQIVMEDPQMRIG